MNMGGPSDHWYTDLFSWNRSVFGEPADRYLREIKRYGGDDLLRDEAPLAQRLWALWPAWGSVDQAELGRLTGDLRGVRDKLRALAEEAGWEVE